MKSFKLTLILFFLIRQLICKECTEQVIKYPSFKNFNLKDFNQGEMNNNKWTFIDSDDIKQSLKYKDPIQLHTCGVGQDNIYLLRKNENDQQNIVYAIATGFKTSAKYIMIDGTLVYIGGQLSDQDLIYFEVFKDTLDKQTSDKLLKNYTLSISSELKSQICDNGKQMVEIPFSGLIKITSKNDHTFRFKFQVGQTENIIGIKKFNVYENKLQDFRFVDETNCKQECFNKDNDYEMNTSLGYCEIKQHCNSSDFYDIQTSKCTKECKSIDNNIKVFPFTFKSRQYCAVQVNLCNQDTLSGCEVCDEISSNCYKCQQGYEKTSDNKCKKLIQCDSKEFQKNGKCLKCSDYIGKCFSCKSDAECIICEQGNFIRKSSGQGDITSCLPCSIGCMKCQKQNECEECLINYEKIGFNCYPQCKEDQFRNPKNGSCENCSTNCKICTNSKICSECQQNMFLQENICVSQCNEGYYIQNNQCLKCMNYCTSCQSLNQCDKCQDQYEFISGICKIKCLSNQFRDENDNCKDCNQNCKSCKKQDKCDECEQYYYLQENLCSATCGAKQYKDEVNKKCQTCMNYCEDCNSADYCSRCSNGFIFIKGGCYLNCLKGWYRNENDPSICEDCSIQMPNCMGCEKSTECQICKYGTGLENHKCVDKCQKGYYIEAKVCKKCDDGCIECDNKDSCRKCDIGYDKIKNKCIARQCPFGQFQILGKICSNCIENCKICENSTQCMTCNDQYNLNIKQQCDEICNEGQYLEKNKCFSCMSGCKKCSSKDVCELCQQNYEQINKKCYKNCDLNQIRNDSYDCQECTKYCQVCNQSNKECSHCQDSFQLINKQCQKQCQPDQFPQEDKCIQCPPECETCKSQNECTSCKNQYQIINKSCQLICKDNQYLQKNPQQSCQNCPLQCKKCENEQKCTQCIDNYDLKNDKCIELCQSGFFYDGQRCSQCTEGCSKCKQSLDCQECQISFQLIQNKCLQKCQNTQYRNTITNVCENCPQNCQKCQDKNICLECLPSSTLKKNLCYQNCSDGQYQVSYGCDACDAGCKKCTQKNYCQECNDGFDLIKDVCQLKCPQRTFRNPKNSTECLNCSKNCIQCKSQSECLYCESKFNLFNNSECIQQCPSGTYSNNFICMNCIVGCKECTWNASCQKCDDTKYDQIKFQCLLKCNSNQFRDENNKCQNCPNNCKQCDKKNQCNICQTGFVFQDTECKNNCNEGFFVQENKCVECAEGCNKCNSRTSCNSCNKEYQLINQICFKNCNQEEFRDVQNNICKPCKTEIEQCMYCSQDGRTCLECQKSSFMYSNKCVLNCPERFYKDEIMKSCQKCPKDCSTCLNENQCSVCDINYSLDPKTKLCIFSSCLTNEYYSFDKKQCIPCSQSLQNCESCSSETKCNNCISPQLNELIDSKCYPKCESKQFRSISKDQFQYQCLSCKSPCSECINLDKCTKCEPSYELIDNDCKVACQINQFKDTFKGICINCVEGCLSCNSSNHCLSCNLNTHILIQNQCQPICKNNQYRDSSGKCINCAEGCLQCKNSQNCFECDQSNLYYLNQLHLCEKLVFICGDGIIQRSKFILDSFQYKNEECDDNNTLNGDGCNSSCIVEKGYICKYDQLLKKSVCNESEYNNFMIKSDNQDPSNSKQTVFVYFKQSIQKEDLQADNIQKMIKVEIEDMIEGQDYYFVCEIISDTQIRLDFALQKNVKKKQIKITVIDQDFSIRNNFKREESQRFNTDLFPNYVQISNEQKQSTETVKQVGNVVSTSIMSSILPIILFSNFSLLFNTLDLFQMIFYLKYVNIRHPYNIIKFLDIFKQFQFPFTPNIYDEFQKRNYGVDQNGVSLHLYSPSKYRESEIDCLFLQNAGQDITQYLILLAIYFFIKLIAWSYLNPFARIRNYIQKKIKTGWEWGWHLDCLWEMYLCLVISSFLTSFEIFYNNSKDIFSVINYILAISCSIFVTAIPIMFFLIIKRNQYDLEKEDLIHRWGMLYEGLVIVFDHSNHKIQKLKSKDNIFDQNFLKIITIKKQKTNQVVPLYFDEKHLNDIKLNETILNDMTLSQKKSIELNLKEKNIDESDQSEINQDGMLLNKLNESKINEKKQSQIAQDNKNNKSQHEINLINFNKKFLNVKNEIQYDKLMKRPSQNSIMPSSVILQDSSTNTRSALKTSQNITLSKIERNYFDMKSSNNHSYLCKYYYVLLYSRKWFFGLFIVFLHDTPLIQLFILELLNAIMFFFIVLVKPFKKKMENFKSATCEVLIFFALITLQILISDEEGSSEDNRILIGWIFVSSCCLILFIQFSFILVEFFKPIVQKIRDKCAKKNQVCPEVKQQEIEQDDNLSIYSQSIQVLNKKQFKNSIFQKTATQTQVSINLDNMQKSNTKIEDNNNNYKVKVTLAENKNSKFKQKQHFLEQNKFLQVHFDSLKGSKDSSTRNIDQFKENLSSFKENINIQKQINKDSPQNQSVNNTQNQEMTENFTQNQDQSITLTQNQDQQSMIQIDEQTIHQIEDTNNEQQITFRNPNETINVQIDQQ